MGKEKGKNKVKMEQIMDRERLAEQLELVAQSLRAGALNLGQDGEAVRLPVPVLLDVAMKAGLKDEKGKFSLKITWKTEDLAVSSPFVAPAPASGPLSGD